MVSQTHRPINGSGSLLTLAIDRLTSSVCLCICVVLLCGFILHSFFRFMWLKMGFMVHLCECMKDTC